MRGGFIFRASGSCVFVAGLEDISFWMLYGRVRFWEY